MAWMVPSTVVGRRYVRQAPRTEMEMDMARRIESLAGALAALIAVTVVVVMVMLGAYSWAVALVGLGCLGAGTCAWQHPHRQDGRGLCCSGSQRWCW